MSGHDPNRSVQFEQDIGWVGFTIHQKAIYQPGLDILIKNSDQSKSDHNVK